MRLVHILREEEELLAKESQLLGVLHLILLLWTRWFQMRWSHDLLWHGTGHRPITLLVPSQPWSLPSWLPSAAMERENELSLHVLEELRQHAGAPEVHMQTEYQAHRSLHHPSWPVQQPEHPNREGNWHQSVTHICSTWSGLQHSDYCYSEGQPNIYYWKNI